MYTENKVSVHKKGEEDPYKIKTLSKILIYVCMCIPGVTKQLTQPNISRNTPWIEK